MKHYAQLALLFTVAAAALAACGQSNIQATQTRAAELSQLATFTAPTAAPTATNTPQPPTATSVPPTATLAATATTTPQPPTPTSLPPTPMPTAIPTVTPFPPTPTPVPDYTAAHARYFEQKSRRAGLNLVVDVTGDGAPEHLYTSYGLGCSSCRLMWVTVFSGPTVLFDDNDYFEPTLEASPDHSGFRIREKAALPGEHLGSTGERMVFTFRWNGGNGKFSLAGQEPIPATAPAPPAGGSVQNYPTPIPSSAATQFKTQAIAAIDQAYPYIQGILQYCSGGYNPLACQGQYDEGTRMYGRGMDQTFHLAQSPVPSQCETLWNRVMDSWGEGYRVLHAPYTRDRSGFMERGEAIRRAQYAQQQLANAKRVIANEPGSCR